MWAPEKHTWEPRLSRVAAVQPRLLDARFHSSLPSLVALRFSSAVIPAQCISPRRSRFQWWQSSDRLTLSATDHLVHQMLCCGILRANEIIAGAQNRKK